MKKKAKETSKKPIKLNAMDVLRAQDAISKKATSMMTADGFENCIAKLGLLQNNALSDSTYEFNLITRNRLLLEAGYRGSWIVGQIIDCVAEDMTRAGVDITTSEAENARLAKLLAETRSELETIKSRKWWHWFVPRTTTG